MLPSLHLTELEEPRKRLLTRTIQLINLLVMESHLYSAPPRLDAVFTALADPTRRAILLRLAQGDASVAELSVPFRISQPAISKHLKMLERAGLIARGIDQQRRPARLLALPMAEAAEWMQQFSRFWAGSFDAMDDLLQQMQSTKDKGENDG